MKDFEWRFLLKLMQLNAELRVVHKYVTVKSVKCFDILLKFSSIQSFIDASFLTGYKIQK